VLRSRDGGQTFSTLEEGPALQRPRGLMVVSTPPYRLFLLDAEPETPPAEEDPSPLWTSTDDGLSFESFPARVVNRHRDPSGEILTLDYDAAVRRLFYGTSRGELLSLEVEGAPRSELIAHDLAPIQVVIVSRADRSIDPSTSGIYVLP